MIARFESPWLLLFLIAVPLLAAWYFLRPAGKRDASLQYASIQALQTSSLSPRAFLKYILPLLRLLTITLIILAVARPQSGEERVVVKGEGVDIALALDISGSMASLDFQPDNRLEAAKQVISDFIDKRPYDRIGLVVFAQNAFHQSPPTIDHEVLLRLLNQTRLASDLGIDDGTAIGMGVANAANMLKDSQAKSKVVILLTDGVNNAGQISPETAAEAAGSLSIKVYTIGMGHPGQVPVPVVDAFGRTQIVYQESQLDEESLKNIAEVTGGLYYRAEDIEGLEQIYDDINRLEKSQVEVHKYTRYQELAGWFLYPALAVFLLEMFLRNTLLRSLP